MASDRFLGVLVSRIVGSQDLDDPACASAVLAALHEAIEQRPAPLRRQIGFFLGLVRWAPVARFGVPFERLASARQDAVLAWFQDAPGELVRKGFWGLKALVFMSYYGRSDLVARLGYRPSREGNTRLHEDEGGDG